MILGSFPISLQDVPKRAPEQGGAMNIPTKEDMDNSLFQQKKTSMNVIIRRGQ